MGLFEIASVVGMAAGFVLGGVVWDALGPGAFTLVTAIYLASGAAFLRLKEPSAPGPTAHLGLRARLLALGGIEGGRLPGHPQRDEPVDPPGEHGLDEPPLRAEVELAVVRERGRQHVPGPGGLHPAPPRGRGGPHPPSRNARPTASSRPGSSGRSLERTNLGSSRPHRPSTPPARRR